MRTRPDCGGCHGIGAHRRYCEAAYGLRAHLLGHWSAEAESLGDSVGSNDVEASNLLWRAAGLLRQHADEAKAEHLARAVA